MTSNIRLILESSQYDTFQFEDSCFLANNPNKNNLVIYLHRFIDSDQVSIAQFNQLAEKILSLAESKYSIQKFDFNGSQAKSYHFTLLKTNSMNIDISSKNKTK